jgi:hypothetical protein
LLLALPFCCRVATAQPAADGPEAAAEAQPKYAEMPVDDGERRNYNTINPMLMAGKFSDPGQQKAFDDYYQKYFLARWTEVKNITSLPAFRKELRNSHLGKKSAGTQVHDYLNALVLDFMKKLASDGYHPAVAVNAMLMIGELNSVESPPTPWPQALEVMLAAVSDEKLPDAVRAAAMVGIQRHATAKIAEQDARRAVTSAMLGLASNDLPAGSDRSGREWILGQAVETLGSLGAVGENNAVFKLLLKTVADSKLSRSTRAIAAEALGRLNYNGAAGISPLETGKVLGRFVSDGCADELRKAKSSEKGISRRRMQQCLTAATAALKAVSALARDPAQQTPLADLQKNLETTSGKIAEWREGDDRQEPVEQLQGDLEAWLKKQA